jgi:hypothetical protein
MAVSEIRCNGMESRLQAARHHSRHDDSEFFSPLCPRTPSRLKAGLHTFPLRFI